jgi:Protein of unknown function (DUF2924)
VKLNVEKELAALRKMTVDGLRSKYAEVFGEPSSSRHKEYLIKRIIWRMQANFEGGLSERALARAVELANEADLRVVAPRNEETTPAIVKMTVASPADRRLPAPGTVITRPYKGRDLQVRILAEGFEYDGERYRTLSAVAKHITGQHLNGFLFFRLSGKGGRR